MMGQLKNVKCSGAYVSDQMGTVRGVPVVSQWVKDPTSLRGCKFDSWPGLLG